MIWVSRNSPNLRKSFLGRRRNSCQAGSGSTSRMTAATDRQRRMATRKSCTASLSGELRRLSSSRRTRLIQWVRPRCSAGATGRAVTVAMRASEDVRNRQGVRPQSNVTSSLSSGVGRVQRGCCGKLEWSAPRARAIFLVGPEWRNWQTQQTQNLPELCSVWVRLPPPGPNFHPPQLIARSYEELPPAKLCYTRRLRETK